MEISRRSTHWTFFFLSIVLSFVLYIMPSYSLK